jgi:multidrug efflux pump subunit AcrB
MLGLGLVPKVFIPDSTDPVITVKLELPTGTDIRHTREVVADIEAFMGRTWLVNESSGRTHGIQSWVTYIGDGGPRFVLGYDPAAADPSNAQMVINATRFEAVFPVMQGLEDYILRQHPDLDVQIKRLSNGPPVGYPVQIRVLGAEIAVLDTLVAGIKDRLYSMPKVSIVSDDWGPRSKKLLVDINQERALRAGVTSDDVAVALQTSLSGLTLSEFRQGDKTIPITLRSVEAERQDIGKLDGVSVYSSSRGTAIPLKQVADTTLAWESALIRRSDRERVITINVQLVPGVTATEVGAELFPWLEREAGHWPHGYDYETGGESETSDEANASLAAALPLGGMAIVLLLIIQFNSFRRPLIILTTIPLGLIGVTIGLLVTRDVFGFFTILGVVSLSGIIINNAIVMLDRIRLEIEENGRTQQDAVLQACQQRLRPILLTTATTIGGMLPLWLGGNVMFETMAVAIIFGLLFATLLTLLVVPVLYSLFFRVNFRQAAS